MTRHDDSEAVEVVDRLLWRDAQIMLGRHAEAGPDGRCLWCGWHWPCPPRRLAERAEIVSRLPRPRSAPTQPKPMSAWPGSGFPPDY